MRHYLAKMLPGPILTVLTRVSSYQAQSKTSLHLASRLAYPLALSSRAWHLPFRPETECAVFRVAGGKNHFEHGRQPFKFTDCLDGPPKTGRAEGPGQMRGEVK